MSLVIGGGNGFIYCFLHVVFGVAVVVVTFSGCVVPFGREWNKEKLLLIACMCFNKTRARIRISVLVFFLFFHCLKLNKLPQKRQDTSINYSQVHL